MGRRNREASNTEEVYESRGLGKNNFFKVKRLCFFLIYYSYRNSTCIYLCLSFVSKFDLHSILRLAAW
jgi:hypothetical protein